LYFWENQNGKKVKQIYDPKYEYYVYDKNSTSNITDIYGNKVVKRTSESRDGIKSLKESGVKCCETDIQMDVKFLQERYKGLNLKVDISLFNICYLDIEIASAGEFPKPEEAKYPINLISLYFSKTKELFTFGLQEYTGGSDTVKNYTWCEDESRLLEDVIDCVRKHSPDIISGWNCEDFDIPYIINRCMENQIERSISSINIIRAIKERKKYIIGGISILDYMNLYKNFTYENQESYSLNFIANAEIKEGKLEFEGQLNDLFKRDWNKFVEYNIQDVMLLPKLENKLKFIELTIRICYQALIPFDKVFSSVAVITGLILKKLHEKNMVMPDRGDAEKGRLPGAYVYAKPGFYRYVVSFDVESLYPTLIREYNISSETIKVNPENKEGLTSTPLSEERDWDTADGPFTIGGIYYDQRKQGIITEVVTDVFNQKKVNGDKKEILVLVNDGKNISEIAEKTGFDKAYVKELIGQMGEEEADVDYYGSQRQIFKILANSIYGVLSNEFFHLYNLNNAIMITLGGQDLIRYLASTIDEYLKKKLNLTKSVLALADTDSLVMSFEEVINVLGVKFDENNTFYDWAEKFCREFLEPLFVKFLNAYWGTYGITNIINFKREKIAPHLIVLAKKKYAINMVADGAKVFKKNKIKITGIEVVRKDTPKFCRERILETIEKIFQTNNKQQVLELMKKVKKDFKGASINDIATPKSISDYDKYTQPIEYYLKNGLSYEKGATLHSKASLNYNYLCSKYKLPLYPITNGTKLKYIYVKENNELHTNIIGFVAQWPEKFSSIFKIDYDLQFEKAYISAIERFFEVLGWGEVNLNSDSMNKFF